MDFKMKILSILIFIFILPEFVFPQNFWDASYGPTGGTVNRIVQNINGDIYCGYVGVFKSSDNCEHWNQTNSGTLIWRLGTIACDSNGTIYISGESLGGYGGIYRSRSNGKYWEDLTDQFHAAGDIFINSKNTIFISTTSLYRSTDGGSSWKWINNNILSSLVELKDGTLLASGLNGSAICKSSDLGESWRVILDSLEGVTAIKVLSNGNILAATWDHGGYVLISTDEGSSWIKNTLDSKIIKFITLTNGNILALTPLNILESCDSGFSWKKKKIILPRYLEIEDIILLHNDRLVIVSDMGIYISFDQGITWSENNEHINNASISALATHDHDIYCGTGRGLFKSTDDGTSWSYNKYLGEYGILCLKISPSKSIYVSGLYMRTLSDSISIVLKKSIDNGKTWNSINKGIEDQLLITLLFSQSGLIYGLSYQGYVFYSNDDGVNWVYCTNIQGAYTGGLAEDSKGYIYAATDEGVFCTNDRGVTWKALSNSLDNKQILDITINSKDDIFISVYSKGIYKSTDYGTTWELINNGMNSLNIRTIVIGYNDWIFVSAVKYFNIKGGIFVSKDGGTNWIDLTNSLPEYDIFSLALDNNGYIYASTTGNGVIRSHRSITENKSLSNLSQFTLNQNYPNPISSNINGNTSTTVSFSVQKYNLVKITVMDVLGREMSVLTNQEYPAGEHSITFNAASLPTGIYFYKM